MSQQISKNWYCQTALTCSIAIGLVIGAETAAAQRRPVADTTLGAERSIVNQVDPEDYQIEGGARRGGNLFHSLRQLSVEAGSRVYFANPSGVERIFARVTGQARSEILGTLGVRGNASLFLLNPNGILFGPQARLDLQGSFLASTADRAIFDNGYHFSATDAQPPPLLTINTPVGLQLAANPAAIRVQRATLSVQAGATLALVGGTVAIAGGALRTLSPSEAAAGGGRIELGSVAANQLIDLSRTNYALGYDAATRFADISLADSQVDVTSSAGSIAINARNIRVASGSELLAGVGPGLNLGRTAAGDITFNATGRIDIIRSNVLNSVQSNATGNSGNLMLAARTIALRDGASIGTDIFGVGSAGDVNMAVMGNLSLAGLGLNGFGSTITSRVQSGSVASGGDITITAGSITMQSGTSILSDTFGRGNAGNVTVTVANTLSLAGVNTSNRLGSTIISSVGPGGVGRGGDITIAAGSIVFNDGAYLMSSTFGQGDAGNINVSSAGSLSLSGLDGNGFSSGIISTVDGGAVGDGGNITIAARAIDFNDGAFISASTLAGEGDAGNVDVVAARSISLSGLDGQGRPSGIESAVNDRAIGNGGTITLAADALMLTDAAVLTVASDGQGAAGNIQVQVRSISLDDRARFSAEAQSGQGGNIILDNVQGLLLQNRSLISTTAGTAQTGGDGGNITINSRFILATPEQDSDIRANAFSGQGGNIQIDTQGLLGIQSAAEPVLGTSDITASSERGVQGVVEINTPDVEPPRVLSQLPTNIVDSSSTIAQTCATQNPIANRQSEFVVTGRGGLPPSLIETLGQDAVAVDLVRINPGNQTDRSSSAALGDREKSDRENHQATAIVEAQGWIVGPQGEVILTAVGSGLSFDPASRRDHCPASQTEATVTK